MTAALVKVAVFAAIVSMLAIRAPHIRRSAGVRVGASFESKGDRALVMLVAVGLALPLLWIVTPLLAFAERPITTISFGLGVACHALGFWLLHRSHADLGENWSNTLELRENHRLVTRGVYRGVRHPMYLALLLYGVGQALVLPNWIAGPSFLVAFALLFFVRLPTEEKMMLREFGDEYRAYTARTKRLLPCVW